MTILSSFGALADHHPYAVHVIAVAVALFSVTFAACMVVIDRRTKARNERRLADRTAQVIASATRTRPAL